MVKFRSNESAEIVDYLDLIIKQKMRCFDIAENADGWRTRQRRYGRKGASFGNPCQLFAPLDLNQLLYQISGDLSPLDKKTDIKLMLRQHLFG